MLLIQSSSSDASTNDVLDWLYYLDAGDIIRLNDSRNIQAVTINISNGEQAVCLHTKDVVIDSRTIDSRWFRRGRLSLGQFSFTKNNAETLALSLNARRYLDHELSYVYDFIEYTLNSKSRSLNKYADDATNKLNNLKLAAELGLSIPDTIVTNVFEDLRDFALKHRCIVTKSIDRNAFTCEVSEGYSVKIGMGTVLLYAEDITAPQDKAGAASVLPALYQQYMEKKIELRIFYLNGSFYPMAIFSQQNEQTRIDFRNYDAQKPNRCVPYRLPAALETQLDTFMKSAGFNSGSIDMILTPEDRYVFLEVNPVGQFQWLNANCNYDINKQIATYLLNDYASTSRL